MTKLEKLRDNLECNVVELKEAWGEYEKERKATDANADLLEIPFTGLVHLHPPTLLHDCSYPLERIMTDSEWVLDDECVLCDRLSCWFVFVTEMIHLLFC